MRKPPVSDDPYRRLHVLAEISAARACGFAGLAILCLMVGLSSSLATTLKAGGYATLLVASVLLLMAHKAPAKPYRRTELWLMLDASERPPDVLAQRLLGEARRAAFLRFAAYHALAAALALVAAFAIGLSGGG